MTETIRTILSRHTCRAFTDEAVSPAMIEALISAGLAAPTAMNKQAFHIAVLTDKELISQLDGECLQTLRERANPALLERILSRGGKVFYNAPVLFIISCAPETLLDVGIVAQNMVLAAASLGLGSCHCGMAQLLFESNRQGDYEKLFSFPAGFGFGLGVLVGHPAGEGKAPHELDFSKVSRIG